MRIHPRLEPRSRASEPTVGHNAPASGPAPGFSLPELLEAMEEAKAAHGVAYYSLSQASLDAVTPPARLFVASETWLCWWWSWSNGAHRGLLLRPKVFLRFVRMAEELEREVCALP
jgi:hypothetical protein